MEELDHIYLGALNYYDLIISKLFRGSGTDFEDCLILVKMKGMEIELKLLEERFRETASFDVSESRVNKNLEHFLRIVKK